MAGNIKGLNIEIGGTTAKLVDALKKPATETQKLKSELKSVNSALKFDSKNVDLLDQKQRLLTKTIESTEAELKLLKEAQKQYIESGKDIDGAEYVVLENKISLCEHSLENLKNQQNNFSGSLQAMGMKATEFGDKTEALGKKLMPVTAGITAIGTAAGVAWNEIDQAYDTIAAGTGATGEALEELKGNFENVFGNFPASAEDTSTALADINTRFGLTDDALEKATEQFLQFSRVNGTDVSGSIENVAKAMYDAGIPTEELGSVLDKLTAVSQASGMTVDDLASKLSENGVSMRQLGFDTSETLAMLATFEKNGVNTSTVLTGMKTAVKNCAKEGKDGKAEMEAFFKKVEDGSVTAQDAIELFGAKSGAAIFQYAQEGKLNFEDLMQVAADSGGQLEASFEEMIDPADKAQLAVNNLKLAGAELFRTIQEVAAPIIEKLVKKCQDLVNWFKNLSDGQKELIVKIGGIAAAIGPVLIGIGKLEKGFGSLIKYFGSTQTWGGKLIASFKSMAGASSIGVGGFVAIGAAIAALVGAFTTLWTTNEEFRDKMISIWEGIKTKLEGFFQVITDRINALGFDFENITEVIGAIWNGFCELLAPVFTGVFEQMSNSIGYFLDTVTGIVDILTGLFTGDWELLWQGVQEVFGAAWDYCKNTFNTVKDIFKGILDTICGWFGTDWKTVWEGIKQPFEDAWNWITEKFQGVVDTIKSIWEPITEFFQGIWDIIKGIWEGDSDLISQGIDKAWNGIKDTTEAVWNAIKEFWEGLWNGLKDFGSGVWNFMTEDIPKAWNSIKSKTSEIWGNIKSFCSETWDKMKTGVSETWDNMKETVSDRWEKIKTGTTEFCRIMGEKLGTKWEELKKDAEDKFTKIKDGIGDAWDKTKSYASEKWDQIKTDLQTKWDTIKTNADNMGRDICNKLGLDWDEVKRTAAQKWGDVKTAILTPFNNAKDAIWDGIQKIKEFFNFQIQWPHIPLPHFTISGSLNPMDWFDGGLPSIGVEWYAKAMDGGKILNQPTIFGMNNQGQLMGAGEAGPEAVVGVSSLREMIYGAVAQATAAQLEAVRLQPSCTTSEPADFDYDRLGKIVIDGIKNLKVEGSVNLDKTKTGKLLAGVVDTQLQKIANQR